MTDAADSSNIKNVGLPILGAGVREKDPVCGMTVDPAKAAAKQELRGNTYYFCSKRCAERFAKEPDKFLSAPGTSAMESAHSGDSAHAVDAHDPPLAEKELRLWRRHLHCAIGIPVVMVSLESLGHLAIVRIVAFDRGMGGSRRP